MNGIIFKKENFLKIEAILATVQEKARIRKIEVVDIDYALRTITRGLGISKKALEGTIATVDCHAQDFPNAYKGIPESTQFEAVFKRGEWRVLKIWRGQTKSRYHRSDIQLSDSAKEAILKKFSHINL